MQALDPETGIIIPAAEPFGDSAMKAGTSGIPGRQSVTLDRTDLFLLKKIQESWIKQVSTIHICAGELPCLDDFTGLSPTFNVLFSIVEAPGNTLIHLHGIGGFSACHLLSRFGHSDPHIRNILEKITGKEKAPEGAIAAEIVFCPPGREADLCVRPELREYEIPVMTHSCKDELHKIYPADLLLCLRNGDLVLKSAKLNRYIIPYASHTLNFQNYDLPLHRLLCELQTQYLGGGMLFDWGALSRLFPALPRVMTGNTILMPASWRFNNDEIARFFSIKNKEDLKKSITRWRYRFRIPARVVWSANDQELPLNLNSFAGIELFLWLCKNRQEILLKEFLMSGTHLVRGRKGYHLHEIIAPFYLEGKERK